MIYKLKSSHAIDDLVTAFCRNMSAVVALEKNGEQYHLSRAAKWVPGKHTLGNFRPVEPVKGLFFKPRENAGAEVPVREPQAAVGVKNCDLSGLQIHDYVFVNSDPVDGFYTESRDKTAIISSDCASPCPSCFCTMVKEQPYPKKGFDINLSATPLGIVVETGSQKGEELADLASALLEPADEAILQAREKKRQEVTQAVTAQAAKYGLVPGQDYQKAVATTREHKLWEEFAKDCVECGACNFTCCTCHCFLLADGLDKNQTPGRLKQWDSCLLLNFARVAGNGNPRRRRAERLYNRFDKKFQYFPQVLGIYACDGCGRCAESCTGEIDIRSVLSKACDESSKSV